MAFYCLTMLSMALELAQANRAYEDMASKFFEHFIHISDAMKSVGDDGLWDEEDGFYYDQLKTPRARQIPLQDALARRAHAVDRGGGAGETRNSNACPASGSGWIGFSTTGRISAALVTPRLEAGRAREPARMLAVAPRERLERVLRYVLDETEFLSPYGMRSLSQIHRDHPYVFQAGQEEHRVDYVPGDSTTHIFGGNSNWRGPVWFPINYLIIEALERYHHFYGDEVAGRMPDRFRQDDEPQAGRERTWADAWATYSCAMKTARGPSRATTRVSRTIRIGAIWCFSTSTSTATTDADLGRAIRPDGRRWWRRCWRAGARVKKLQIPNPKLQGSSKSQAQARRARLELGTSLGFGAWDLELSHSVLNAVIGLTFVARRAGKKHASNAALPNNVAATISASGSAGLTL